jgi:hypothetical protein
MDAQPDPTPAEIAAACAGIRAAWTDSAYRRDSTLLISSRGLVRLLNATMAAAQAVGSADNAHRWFNCLSQNQVLGGPAQILSPSICAGRLFCDPPVISVTPEFAAAVEVA